MRQQQLAAAAGGEGVAGVKPKLQAPQRIILKSKLKRKKRGKRPFLFHFVTDSVQLFVRILGLGHPLTPLATVREPDVLPQRLHAAGQHGMPVAAAWQPAPRLAGVMHNCNKNRTASRS